MSIKTYVNNQLQQSDGVVVFAQAIEVIAERIHQAFLAMGQKDYNASHQLTSQVHDLFCTLEMGIASAAEEGDTLCMTLLNYFMGIQTDLLKASLHQSQEEGEAVRQSLLKTAATLRSSREKSHQQEAALEEPFTTIST